MCLCCGSLQLEIFPRLREETERIVTSHIRDRENRAKDQVGQGRKNGSVCWNSSMCHCSCMLLKGKILSWVKKKRKKKSNGAFLPQLAATHRDLVAEVGDSCFSVFLFFFLHYQHSQHTLWGWHLQRNHRIIKFLCHLWWAVISIVTMGRFLGSSHTCCTRSLCFKSIKLLLLFCWESDALQGDQNIS